jgi:uroporphyrinogen decarboxylase
MPITSKERVQIALSHKEPDRIPIEAGGFLSGINYLAYENLRIKLGLEPKEREFVGTITGTVKLQDDVLKMFNVDTRYVYIKDADDYDPEWRYPTETDGYEKDWNLGISFIDKWGIRWTKPPTSYYFDIENRPLANATIEDLKKWDWPNPKAKSRTSGLREQAKKISDDGYAVFSIVEGPFEVIQYILGLENLFVKIYDNPKLIHWLFDKVTEIMTEIYSSFMEKVGDYMDCVLYYSDLGEQRGTIVSPKTWREFAKPREKEIVKVLKGKGKTKVAFHSCGSCWDLMDDLIEIGVDVLNPVQTSAAKMDAVKLKEKYGDLISFWGGVDTQTVISRGAPEQVCEESKRMICAFGKNGGYLFGSCHNIQNLVPPENILALFETGYKFGKYPLNCK